MKDRNPEDVQLELFDFGTPVVHYYDRNGALHTGKLVRRIMKGKRKGFCVVINAQGRKMIPFKIRNIG